MASSRVICICLLVTICLYKAAQSAPLNFEEEEEDINEIDFEEENLDDFDDVLKDPDYVPEYDYEEWEYDEEYFFDPESKDEDADSENEENESEEDEENESEEDDEENESEENDEENESEENESEDDEVEEDSDDEEIESEDDADEENEGSKNQNRRKRDLEDLDDDEEEIDPELKELLEMEAEEDSGIHFSLKDRETSKIRDQLLLDSLGEEKVKDTKAEHINEYLDYLNTGDLEKPAFMEDMHRGAMELLSSISKSDSE